MYTILDKTTIETQEASIKNFSWNEYCHYHDYFVELLSYGRKHNYTQSNIWEFCYV